MNPALHEHELSKLRDRLIADCALATAHALNVRVALGEEIDRANEAIIDIFNALLRIDAGVYGTCCHCGAPVPFAALDANPRERCCPGCSTMRPVPPSSTHATRPG